MSRPPARDYGPVQLAVFLGLETWQFTRARRDGLIPDPDRARGRWPAAVADAVLARIDAIRAAAGSVPDLGAVRAAEVLSARLGAVVTSDGVEELARRGLLPVAGHYKDCPLYDGRALESFTDLAAAVDASWAGQLRSTDQAAAYLRIRRCDLGHLIRAGLLTPAKWGRGPWCAVPLYRTGDLDRLAARDDLGWPAVRATAHGQRSPLSHLPTAPEAGRGCTP